jgi:hypothetical protein
MPIPTRRTVLKWGLMGGAAGVAGCTSVEQTFLDSAGDAAPPNQTATDTDSPTPVSRNGWYVHPGSPPKNIPEQLNCPGETIRQQCENPEETRYDSPETCERVARRYQQIPDEDDIEWGTVSGTTWSLLVDDVEYRRGEEIELRLSGSHHRGVAFMYDLQVRTKAGWENLRYHVGYGPGRGFNDIMEGGPTRWTIQFSDDGFEITFYEGRTQTNRPFVCPAPPDGRYRFVYWGTCDTESDGCQDNDTGLAVAFDLVE